MRWAKKVVALNDKMPELKDQAKIILDLQEKIPEIQNAGKQLAEIDGDFCFDPRDNESRNR